MELYENKSEENESADGYEIDRTVQHPKCRMTHTIIYALFFIVMMALTIVFFVKKFPTIPFILLAFAILFLILLFIAIFLQVKYNKKEKLPATMKKDGISFSDGTFLSYKEIKSVSCVRAYEKMFFMLIGSDVSAYTFGNLKIVKSDGKAVRLYYIENVRKVREKIIEKL